MLWIALYLPDLSLEAAARGAPDRQALALAEGPANRPLVCAANAAARSSGVVAGMPLAAAQALCAELLAMPRDSAREAAALVALAGWAGQFTPTVSVDEGGAGLLLEVEGSLELFGGLMPLLARVRRGVRELGFTAVPGVAPTPLAAWWLAQARHVQLGVRSCVTPAHLEERLRPLPLAALGWPRDDIDRLEGLGIRRLGGVLDLPRDGFSRRFGPTLTALLDKALGRLPDPRALFSPSETFSSRLELPAEVEHVEALLFPLRRLLAELQGFLRGRGCGVQRLDLVAEHTAKGRTRISLGLTAPAQDGERLLSLLREKLSRVELPRAVVALDLSVEALLPFVAENASFFPDGASRGGQWRQLQERLHARLGAGRVHALGLQADHRPERAWRSVSAAATAMPTAGKAGASVGVSPAALPRPVWLLPAPRQLHCRQDTPEYHGPLVLLMGPERIESGWWDGQPASRDYFVARSRRGELLWVYRDHRTPEWYLHGVFA